MNCDWRANTEDCHRQACYLVMDGTTGNHEAIDSRRPGNGPLPVCIVQPQHLSTICGDLFPVHPSAALGAAAVIFCFGQEPVHKRSSTRNSAPARREMPLRMEVNERARESAIVEVAPVETESVAVAAAEAVLVVTEIDAMRDAWSRSDRR